MSDVETQIQMDRLALERRGRSPGSMASGSLALALIAIVWGINFSVIKVGLDSLEPFAFNALRFPIASLVLLIVLLARGQFGLPEREDFPRILVLGLLGNVVYQVNFIIGIDRTLAGNASLLLATTPVWTAVLSAGVGHERLKGAFWLGLLGAIAGMVLVVIGNRTGLRLSGDTAAGDLLMVGASMVWAVYTVGSRDLIRRYGPLPLAAWTLWAGTAGLLVLGAPDLVSTDFSAVGAGAWISVMYAGAFGIGIAYALWYYGVDVMGSARTALYSNAVPVVAIVVAWIWLAERPSWHQLVGATLILGGITYAKRGAEALKAT